MPKLNLEVFEGQQPGPLKPSKYEYVKKERNGVHVFRNEDGKIEIFARRGTAYAGWNLKRGSYFYEFVSSR